MRRLYLTACISTVLAGCGAEPKFALDPATMDCEQRSCLITFGVSSKASGELLLVYDVSLTQNYVRDPNRSGLVLVGAAEGEIRLPPNESKTVEVEIEVTETPNGSKVHVFDSQTPSYLVELLDIDPI